MFTVLLSENNRKELSSNDSNINRNNLGAYQEMNGQIMCVYL